VLNPNKRSINTFWPINYEAVKDNKNLELFEGTVEVVNGITVKPYGRA